MRIGKTEHGSKWHYTYKPNCGLKDFAEKKDVTELPAEFCETCSRTRDNEGLSPKQRTQAMRVISDEITSAMASSKAVDYILTKYADIFEHTIEVGLISYKLIKPPKDEIQKQFENIEEPSKIIRTVESGGGKIASGYSKITRSKPIHSTVKGAKILSDYVGYLPGPESKIAAGVIEFSKDNKKRAVETIADGKRKSLLALSTHDISSPPPELEEYLEKMEKNTDAVQALYEIWKELDETHPDDDLTTALRGRAANVMEPAGNSAQKTADNIWEVKEEWEQFADTVEDASEKVVIGKFVVQEWYELAENARKTTETQADYWDEIASILSPNE